MSCRRSGGEAHGEFEQVQCGSSVACGKSGQVLEKIIVDERGGRVVGAFGSQRSLKDRGDVLVRKLLQRKGATAGKQCVLHLERWILRRRPNQRDQTTFNRAQEDILLAFGKPVDLVAEDDRLPPGQP